MSLQAKRKNVSERKARKPKVALTKDLSDHPVITRVISLHRQEAKLAEGKGEEFKPSEALSSSIDLASTLVDPNVVYTFRLVAWSNMASSIGGVVSGFSNFDPTGNAEFTALKGLFGLVRLKESRFTITMFNPHSDGYATGQIRAPIFISCDGGKNSTTPTSVQSVIDCPRSKMISTGDTGTHTLVYKAKDVPFADVAAPAPGPYAGCYGEWQWYASGLTASITYATFMIEYVIEMTART
jgi:hypothetical protein